MDHDKPSAAEKVRLNVRQKVKKTVREPSV